MKKIKEVSLIIILSITAISSDAQNLVPNGSFEDTFKCPTGPGGIVNAPPWNSATLSTPAYFNECNAYATGASIPYNTGGSYQYANTGKGYAGINTYVKPFLFRNYIQTVLRDTLIAGSTYCVSFYVNCADAVNYAIDALGAYFSKTPVTCTPSSCLLNLTPQISNPVGNIITDTANWTKISDFFIAVGGEKYITIGNFRNDASTNTVRINTIYEDESYYYIDDVSVSLLEKVNAGVDQNSCLGDSVKIGPANNDIGTYSWSPAAGLSDTAIAQPIASPLQTTAYILTKTTSCNVSKDTVIVSVKENCLPPSSLAIPLPNIFSPNNDGANDVFIITSKNIKTFNCKIYDRWGILVAELKNVDEVWDGRTIAGEECITGVYYYLLQATGEDKKEYSEKGFVQLIK